MHPSRFHPASDPSTNNSCDVGLVGLAVMGANFALNMADHAFSTSVYNRTTSVSQSFISENPSTPGGLHAFARLEDFVASLKRPRRIVILVKAGAPTDAVIDSLTPLLSPGDIIIDGGNAHWADSTRRDAALTAKGFHFVGSGVSGGETGARFGPSLMAGCSTQAWSAIEPIWTAIAAKVDPASGKPLEGATPGKPVNVKGADSCAARIGPNPSGHFVKMVHNGIEYADMQMICEAYDILRRAANLSSTQLADVFAKWNTTDLDSFLIEITADILRQSDPVTKQPFVDVVLDAAGQKGTGMWTSTAALDLGVPAPTITEAVFARNISAHKAERVHASSILKPPSHTTFHGELDHLVEDVRQALLCSKACAYAQGFAIINAAAQQQKWSPDFASISRIWRGGCIIRARFLHHISTAYASNPALPNLLLDPYFAKLLADAQPAWRRAVALAATLGIPAPTFSSALAYYDSLRADRLPANLLQAQRDYFGAHTYERLDQPRGHSFHLDWTHPQRPQNPA